MTSLGRPTRTATADRRVGCPLAHLGFQPNWACTQTRDWRGKVSSRYVSRRGALADAQHGCDLGKPRKPQRHSETVREGLDGCLTASQNMATM